MPEARIPLATPSEPRDETLTKDSLLTNCFIDQSKVGTMYAVKRPGFTVGTEGITTDTNRGIFYHNGTVYYIDENDTLQGFIPPGTFYPSYYTVTEVEDVV